MFESVKGKNKRRDLAIPSFFISVLILSFVQFENEPDSLQRSYKLAPPVGIKSVTLGYNELLADTLWIRVIQDIDYCESENTVKSYNPGIKADEALTVTLRPSRCDRGWVFQYLDLITDLAPKFRSVYFNGATNLAVAVDDREGARLLVEKGLKQFPKEWRLAYLGSYIYLFEFQKPERAADLLLQASQNGGPSWLPVLASRLYSSAGRKALGRSVLEEFIKAHPGGTGEKRARERLRELDGAN